MNTVHKTTHTDGPWSTNNATIYGPSRNGLATPIAVTQICDNVTDRSRVSNARLIAAAPELLKALENLERFYANDIRRFSNNAWDEIVHAIAKAKEDSA